MRLQRKDPHKKDQKQWHYPIKGWLFGVFVAIDTDFNLEYFCLVWIALKREAERVENGRVPTTEWTTTVDS